MSKVEFGVMLRQQKIEFPEIKDAAQLCDKLGYDSVWFYDHVLGQGIIGIDILEPWTLMSALSTVTENIKLGTMVLCNGFRHPPLLAKMAATLDYISSGRLELALGAGWFEQEFTTYGYAVFGEVIDGMDVVDKIAAVQTGTDGQFRDVPQEPIVINSAKVVE